VPWPAERLGIPLRIVGPEPWSLGIRLRHEAKGAHRLDVDPAPPGLSPLVSRCLRGAPLSLGEAPGGSPPPQS
jgi:hypothetical protein